MPERVRITDVSPRDGLQNEPGIIPSTEKVRLIEMLCASGVDEVEATSFVSPKWIPQLGDASEVLASIGALVDRESGVQDKSSTTAPPPRGRGLGGGSSGDSVPHRRFARKTDRARDLRKNMTHPEVVLWNRLRNEQIDGVRFRRQLSIGPFIVDFCAPSHRLIIEVDGRTHGGDAAIARDHERDDWLLAEGYQVVRVSNDDVLQNTVNVVRHIREALAARKNPLPGPLPEGEGGRGSFAGSTLPVILPVISALVPNEKGMERAIAAHESGLPLKVALFTAASETFNKKNINATIAESVERFRPVVSMALERRMPIRVYISCAVACPFEGPIPPAQVAETVAGVRTLFTDADWRDVDVDLGDTIGVAHRRDIQQLLDAFDASQRARITLHLHDTFGRAGECVVRALEMGVRSFDGSAGGLGGCPYASTDDTRAPGNISTELLVQTIEHAGYETGVDHEMLRETGVYAREIVRKANSAAIG